MTGQDGQFGAARGIPQPRRVVLGGGQHARPARVEDRAPDPAFMAAQDGQFGAARGIR
jgi:hypothetical protein